MNRPYDLVTFDCYGTLIDWESGIVDAVIEAAAARGVTLDRTRLLALHAEIEPIVQAEAFRSYRDVLSITASRIAGRLGWRLDERAAAFLPQSLPGWPPFEDTNAALERLRAAGYRLGILSNVDDDLLAGTLAHLTVQFEPVVTAQQVRSYKPDPGHFAEARRRIGDGVRWLHAAQSWFHDVVPAHAFGIPVVWVNRKNELPKGDVSADRDLRDLTALADWLAP